MDRPCECPRSRPKRERCSPMMARCFAGAVDIWRRHDAWPVHKDAGDVGGEADAQEEA